MPIRGSVDAISSHSAVGWAIGPQLGPMLVQARLRGRVMGEALADRFRPDLAAAGLGDGQHGFEVMFTEELDPAVVPAVTIHPADGDVVLPRTSLAGLHDVLEGVTGRFPAAGRHRSVFGGLWVDRTDAARLLRGRLATGATPAAQEAPLRRLIEDGVVPLGAVDGRGSVLADAAWRDGVAVNAPLDPREGAAVRDGLEALADLLFQPLLLDLLRAVLDDHPVAVRAVLLRGEGGFDQPSTAEALPSPAECVLVVVALGGGCALDVVRGSHLLPEFTAAGQSRWTTPGAAAGLDLALAHGASLDTLELDGFEAALVGAGSICRLRSENDGAALMVWCVPSRQTPRRLLTDRSAPFTVRHESGGMVVV